MGAKRQRVGLGPSPKAKRRAVAVDNLSWRRVEVTSKLDDAEGFYGLEEVEDVEVVRGEDGQVQFLARSSAKPAPPEEDEFEGFSADESPSAFEDENVTLPEEYTRDSSEAISDGSEGPDEQLQANVFTKMDPATLDAEYLPEWEVLKLSGKLLNAIGKLGFETPTPIQKAAIPKITEGRDVIGKAVTGSGKTLAFAIPIVEKWLSSTRKQHPLALVISPTRELAHQITKHFKDLCEGLPQPPYVCSVTGGLSVLKQQRQLEKADVVIATPGRMWEVMSSSTKLLDAFQGIQFLVLDEADRLIADGHFEEARQIFDALQRVEFGEDGEPRQNKSAAATRQTLVFSATFNKALQQKLAGRSKFNDDLMDKNESLEYLLQRINFRERPVYLDVNPVSQMATGLKEGLIECGAMEKDLFLYSVLLLNPDKRALVFTNSITSVRRLTPMLANLGIAALPLQSQMPQKARLRSLERFAGPPRQGGKPAKTAAVLVATDVAARGLDITDVDLVVHYHVPRSADAYVHRSGRTARAEKSGMSVLLCSPDEVTPLRRLVAKLHATSQAKAARAEKNGASKADKKEKAEGRFSIHKIDLDRTFVARIRERVTLAKKVADAELAKEKGRSEDNQLRQAAEDLGVEYDSDEMEKAAGKWRGRGGGRKQKQKELEALTKRDMAALKARLRDLLSERINLGVSKKYIASGQVAMSKLVGDSRFLGDPASVGFDL